MDIKDVRRRRTEFGRTFGGQEWEMMSRDIAVARGQVVKVPLGKMPVIDTPFDRVAVDLVGPIFPATEKGYKYILTMVDYATRYPAQPLKDIHTETVAEALVNMFARVGIPR